MIADIHERAYARRGMGGRRGARGGSQLSAAVRSTSAVHGLVPYSWPIVANYTPDGGTGKVASIADNVRAGTGIKAAVPAHSYAQAVSGSQIALPTARASLNNKLAGAFAAAPYYVSSAPASAWRNPSNGLGFTAYTIMDRIGVVGIQFSWSTYGPTGETGAGHIINGATMSAAVYNAAALTVLASAGSETTGPTFNATSLAAADTPDCTLYRRSSSVATANASGGFAAGDPAGTMVLGANRSGGQPVNAHIAEWLFFDRALTAAEHAIVRWYIASNYLLS